MSKMAKEDRNAAMALASKSESRFIGQEKPGIIKKILGELKEFLFDARANKVVTLIVQFL